MNHTKRSRVSIPVSLLAGLAMVAAQPAPARDGARSFAPSASQATSVGYVTPFFFPSYEGFAPYNGFYGGYYSPFVSVPSLPPPYSYMPKYWWVESYPSVDPRQDGYNPDAGYPKEEVTTLLLDTYPAKARVVLDGLYVGTTDSLGPFQLPMGEHTLRIEAAGFEPSETVLKVEQPVLQQLAIRLRPAAPVDTPAKRK